MCARADIRLVGFKRRFSFLNVGCLSVRHPSLWASRTGVVHLMVKGKCSVGDCECNYSGFASLGVRRCDPAYRSDS